MFETYLVINGKRYIATPHPASRAVCSFITQRAGGVWSGEEVSRAVRQSPYDHVGSAQRHSIPCNSHPQVYRNNNTGELVAACIIGNSQWLNGAYELKEAL